jgi:sugar lactone lactonase YvrE
LSISLAASKLHAASTGYTFTTLAGPNSDPANPFSFALDGPVSAAVFNVPNAIAIDAAGNFYVANSANDTIRKILAGGAVSTIAGTAGTALGLGKDGIGAAADFDTPSGIAVDSQGNVYVADTNNSTIRKITPAGVVSTLAGTARSIGSSDGIGGLSQFYYPSGIALDGSGNLYVADRYNHTIRKITPAGVVSTLAGTAGVSGSADGTGSVASFNPTSAARSAKK